MSWPLAAALLLTHCGCSLGDFFWLAGFCVLIFSMRKGYRPPGAIFFLLRRRKNMERKTPRRAGCSPPYEPTPLGGCRWRGWVSFDYQANLRVHPCPIPGEQTACRFAVAYEGAGVVWGVAWSVASALNGVTLLVGTRSGVGTKGSPERGAGSAERAV